MTRRRGARFLTVTVVAVLTLLVAAACGDDGDDDTASGDDGSSAGDAASSIDGGDDGGGDGAASDDGAASGDVATGERGSGALSGEATLVSDEAPSTTGRSIVFTGSVTVEVDELVSAGARASVATETLGGFVAAEQSGYGTHPETVLTLRVPPESFRTLLGRLGDLGEVTSQSVESTDVTERVVDLESRISTVEVSVGRLRDFLAGATTTSDVRELEAELVSRETELETLRGERRTVESRVSLSTIVATLVPADVDGASTTVDDDGLPGFAEALGGGWDAFLRIGSGLVVGVLAALPFLVLATAMAAVGVGVVRRPRIDGSATPPPPGPTADAGVSRA